VPTRVFSALTILGFIQAPLLLYDYHVFTTVPAFHAWAIQNVTLSPPPWHYVLGYGIVGGLAAVGIGSAWRASRRTPWLLLWIVTVFILAYLPWRLQRRFVESVHVALSILAAYGLVHILMPPLSRQLHRLTRHTFLRSLRVAWLGRTLIIVLASISNLYLIASYTASTMIQHPDLFHSRAESEAVTWLAQKTTWDDVILASYEDGNWIVGQIGHRVVLGHWAETINAMEKADVVQAFYAGALSPAQQRSLVHDWRVRYVYLHEGKFPYHTPAALHALDMRAVFDAGPVHIYEVAR
jgi:hypothetical protein